MSKGRGGKKLKTNKPPPKQLPPKKQPKPKWLFLELDSEHVHTISKKQDNLQNLGGQNLRQYTWNIKDQTHQYLSYSTDGGEKRRIW